MSPAEYAAKFWYLNVFVTAESAMSASADSGHFSMTLPDPKSPGIQPARPMDPGRWQRSRVDRYRLNDSGYGHFLTQALRNQDRFGIKIQRIDGVFETLSVLPKDISYALVAPFWGKGYPEECAIVLQLWQRYGIAKASAASLISQGLIGLDCNGFVGGYIDRRNAPAAWSRKAGTRTSYYIRDLLGTAYFRSWDDFRPPGEKCLLMGLCDASGTLKDHNPKDKNEVGHIVITEPGTLSKSGPNGPVSVEVVEATGPVGQVGLQRSRYNILSMTPDSSKKAIFYVQRGSKAGTKYEHAHFRITQLN